jgi:hypothetical protein
VVATPRVTPPATDTLASDLPSANSESWRLALVLLAVSLTLLLVLTPSFSRNRRN